MNAEEWAKAVARAEAPVLARWNPDEETTEREDEGGSKAADEGGSKASEGGSKASDSSSGSSSHPPLVAVRALRAASRGRGRRPRRLSKRVSLFTHTTIE